MSQKVTIFEPLTVLRQESPGPAEAAWSVSGMPADCVKVALKVLLDFRPDFVLSGVNNGFNAGYDTAYSGTVAAAMEALMNGIPALAFSMAYNRDTETAETFLPALLEELLQKDPGPAGIWNVNFPGVPARDCKGILYQRAIAPLQIYQDRFDCEDLEDGGLLLQNTGGRCHAEDAPEGSDIRAVLSDYISVGTLRCPVL